MKISHNFIYYRFLYVNTLILPYTQNIELMPQHMADTVQTKQQPTRCFTQNTENVPQEHYDQIVL